MGITEPKSWGLPHPVKSRLYWILRHKWLRMTIKAVGLVTPFQKTKTALE
jgi:hypothetical protein